MFDLGALSLGYSAINALVAAYGYYAIFFLMLLEAASFPVPSEIVLPAVGYFAAMGTLNLELGFAAALLGSVAGMIIDYYIAYILDKEVVYKHLHFFHIKKETLLAFDSWFAKNGAFAVFVSRLLPLVRALINFPAGFAQMPMKKFLFYSIAGTLIWNVLLVAFGYYALSIDNAYEISALIGAFAVVLYLVYSLAMKKIRRKAA